MNEIVQPLVWLLLIWSIYHLVRDLLQDVFNIRHPLIDLFHRPAKRNLPLPESLHKIWSIPIMIGIVPFSVAFLATDRIFFGLLAVGLFGLFLILWLWTTV